MRSSISLMMRVGRLQSPEYLVEMREIIEPEIAALAAERADAAQVAALREAIERMDGALHQSEAYIAADNDFHLPPSRWRRAIR